jgi:hypothetical protein
MDFTRQGNDLKRQRKAAADGARDSLDKRSAILAELPVMLIKEACGLLSRHGRTGKGD